MDPVCFYAVFAEEARRQQNGVDLLNVHNQRVIVPLDPDVKEGVSEALDTLWIQIAADPGPHVISFVHEGEEYLPPAHFEVPETGSYLLGVEREFPMIFQEGDTPNAYPIFLDGSPFTIAYMWSHTM